MPTTENITDEDKVKAEQILREKLGDSSLGDAIPSLRNSDTKEKGLPPETEQDDIEKNVGHKEWVFEGDLNLAFSGEPNIFHFKESYIQKPLSYIAMTEFSGLLGRKLAEAMRGPDGLSIDRMVPGEAGMPIQFQDGRFSISDNTGGIDAIVQAFAYLASYVPDVVFESQCIWLRVPRHKRDQLMQVWALPVDEGGMSIDEGEEMLSIFIEQNYDELDGFLKRYGRVKNKFQKMRKRAVANKEE